MRVELKITLANRKREDIKIQNIKAQKVANFRNIENKQKAKLSSAPLAIQNKKAAKFKKLSMSKKTRFNKINKTNLRKKNIPGLKQVKKASQENLPSGKKKPKIL